MQAILEQVKSIAQRADDAGRKELINTLRDLCFALETPHDSMQRLLYVDFQTVFTRVGCDLDLFKILSESEDPMTVAQLSEKTKAAPGLLNRILRYLASQRIIGEVGVDQFTANQMTRTLAIPGFEGAIYHNNDTIGPALRAMPAFLEKNNYRDISDMANCPFQLGHSTDLPAFMWLPHQPVLFEHFNKFMTVQRLGMPTWLDVYPYQQKANELAPEQVFFVDVGGGFGHQCIALRKNVPQSTTPNKVILQDMAPVASMVGTIPEIEVQAHDFWTPQPVRGAKIYYMRNVMHDYPEDRAAEILKNTKSAMGPDSVILIDDMIIPDSNAHWQATQLDVTMMIALASIERTQPQWKSLIEKAGLKISRVYKYTTSLGDSILECVRA